MFIEARFDRKKNRAYISLFYISPNQTMYCYVRRKIIAVYGYLLSGYVDENIILIGSKSLLDLCLFRKIFGINHST